VSCNTEKRAFQGGSADEINVTQNRAALYVSVQKVALLSFIAEKDIAE